MYFPKVLEAIKLKKESRILDVGCALGYFLRLCDDIGCDTYGLDISEYAISHAKKQTKAKLYIHDVNKGLPMFPNDMFDLVILFDIIEHLDSPLLSLRHIRRTLKIGGKLIITTPNLNAIDRILRRILRKEETWYGFADATHVNLFTPSSLRFLIVRAGFETVETETPFHTLPKRLKKMAGKTGLGGQIWLVGTKVGSKIPNSACRNDPNLSSISLQQETADTSDTRHVKKM